jgi:hypothetical protein
MEGKTHAPPTSSKLIQFPRISNEDKHRKPAAITRSFTRNLLHCFTFFSSKKPQDKNKAEPAQPAPERKALRTSTISTSLVSKMDSNIEALPYRWPHDSSFDPKTTALVIIDMQKDCKLFSPPSASQRSLILNY